MAQWKYGPYDWVWHEKLETNLRLLRSAADVWALRGADALAVDQVLAVLLRVFGARWSVFDRASDRAERARPLAQWLSGVETPDAECGRLVARPVGERIASATRELQEVLGAAARDWSRGNPEEPPTDSVLRALAAVLFRHHLAARPPPSRLEI